MPVIVSVTVALALLQLYAQLGVTPWLSALIVALATMGFGYALVSKGRANLSRANLAPTQTIETLKETATWQTRTPA